MKTLIVSSSLSANSRSFLLCKEVEKRLKEKGIDVDFVDARDLDLKPYHRGPTQDMKTLAQKVAGADNYVIGMGIHCYSINDGLKVILDSCFGEAEGKFFGIVCAAGGQRSYLSTMHLTQIALNEWRLIQLPRIVYATHNDFSGDDISEGVRERLDLFADEFSTIGKKLL